MNRFLLFWAALSIGGQGTTFAQLKWDRTEIDVSAKAGDREARAEYPFTNAGRTPVEITKIKASCACTKATADRKIYKPGEKGVVRAVFIVGNHRGLQSKTIAVDTTGAKARDRC